MELQNCVFKVQVLQSSFTIHSPFFLFSVKKDYGLKYASNDYLRVGNHQSKDGNLIIVTIKKFSNIETIKS
jgi:hypothetical protein